MKQEGDEKKRMKKKEGIYFPVQKPHQFTRHGKRWGGMSGNKKKKIAACSKYKCHGKNNQ